MVLFMNNKSTFGFIYLSLNYQRLKDLQRYPSILNDLGFYLAYNYE